MAKTVQREPGSDNIDDVTPNKPAKRGEPWVIRWRYWPADGSPATQYRHQGRTKGSALAAARAKAAALRADEMARDDDEAPTWTLDDSMADYLDTVVEPAIDRAEHDDGRPLTDGSKRLQRRSLALLRGQCRNTDHDHSKTELSQFTIRVATRGRTGQAAVEYIAATHGRETARQALSFLNRYVYGELIADRVIADPPMRGVKVRLGDVKAQLKPDNAPLPAATYHRVLDHLLTLDPATEPRKKRSRESSVVKRRKAIDITLVQMATGLRFTETRTLTPDDVLDNARGGVNIHVPAAKAKGGKKARTVTVLDDRVAERVRTIRDATPDGHYLFGAPADGARVWDQSNASKAVATLYADVADKIDDADVLAVDFRSHGWRSTLNMIHMKLPAALRSEWFGHTEQVNSAHYSDFAIDHSEFVASHNEGRERHLRAVE